MLFLVFPQVSCCQSKLSMSCPCSSSSRRADGAGGYKHRATLSVGHTRASCPGSALPVCQAGMLGWRLCSPQLPLKCGVPSLRQAALALHRAQHWPFPVYAWQTWHLSIWGSHKLFQAMHGNTAGSSTGKSMCKPGLPVMP